MKIARIFAVVFLVTVFAAALLADVLAPASYETQFRENPSASPSQQFPLGTDALGRDRLSRLLYGARVSLLLAPAAALLSTALAAAVGLAAGFLGGWFDRGAMAFTDLLVSVPSLFLLLTARALLPLNVPPSTSVTITFVLLAAVGWAPCARVLRTGTLSALSSSYVLQARACGTPPWRIAVKHVLANLRPLTAAQFWIFVPVFMLAEANLGMLGLGVTEPLPSWGNLLAELQDYRAVIDAPAMLAPLVLLILVQAAIHLVFSKENA